MNPREQAGVDLELAVERALEAGLAPGEITERVEYALENAGDFGPGDSDEGPISDPYDPNMRTG